MKQSNEFMLLLRFNPSESYTPTEAETAEQHQQWGQYIGQLAMQEKLISTHQLGFNGRVITASAEVSDGIYTCESETLGGNLIVRANDIEEAVEIGRQCPILLMGGSVEVRDVLPMD